MNKYKIVSIVVAVVTIILAVVSLILLPDMVLSQITANGLAGNSLPKPAAVLIPSIFGLAGAFGIYTKGKEDRWDWKSFVLVGACVFVFVFMYIFNH